MTETIQQNETDTTTLFDRLGGASAVDAAVDIFYRKVLSDSLIAGFFDAVDMDAQRNKQKAFLTMVFGGPNEYTGKDMRSAHSNMNIEESHFDAVVTHLGDTLAELGAAQDDINEVAGLAMSVKSDVLGK